MENERKTISKEMLNELGVYELRELANKQDRTSGETERFNELNNKANSEYQ